MEPSNPAQPLYTIYKQGPTRLRTVPAARLSVPWVLYLKPHPLTVRYYDYDTALICNHGSPLYRTYPTPKTTKNSQIVHIRINSIPAAYQPPNPFEGALQLPFQGLPNLEKQLYLNLYPYLHLHPYLYLYPFKGPPDLQKQANRGPTHALGSQVAALGLAARRSCTWRGPNNYKDYDPRCIYV